MPNTKLSTESDMLLSDNDLIFWEHDGKTYMCHIKTDDEPSDPRRSGNDCNLATLACFHARHTHLGDKLNESTPGAFWENLVRKHVKNGALLAKIQNDQIDGFKQLMSDENVEIGDPEAVLELFYGAVSDGQIRFAMSALDDRACILPVYLYEHSGLTISCGERAHPFNDRWDSSHIGWAVLDKKTAMSELGANENDWKEKAETCIKSEIASYDKYLTGDIWMYALYESNRPIGENEGGRYPNGKPFSDDDAWGDILEETCGFEGSYLVASGIPDSIGCGMPDALSSGNYWTGRAEPQTVIAYTYVRDPV